MKFNEIIVESTISDRENKVKFDNSVKIRFINTITKEIKQEIEDSARANQPLNMDVFISDYLKKAGWGVESDDKVQLKLLASQAANNPAELNKLAELIYSIGTKNAAARDPAKQAANVLAPSTQQTINQITKLTGPENNDDLEQIAKTAMTMLYSQNRARYNSLYREIVSGVKSGAPKQPEDNPNIVRGTNESKRR